MTFELVPFLTFAIVTSITPGPNNISSMAFCMSQGYKKTVPYILGIMTGTFIVMLICASLSFGLSALIPEIAAYLKYIGAAYIFYLAYKMSKLNVDVTADQSVKSKFMDGAILQLVNPKAIFYGMTIYSTFFYSFLQNKIHLSLSALLLAMFTFTMVSSWGLFGAALKHYLKNKIVKRIFILIMVGGLIFAAIDILLK
ncbi:LysE family translocator [Labilibacter sediminis]|nr:LysE family translocator [Labilibacter sediminis]